ncbi:murein L,D-transpeptidase catalytic domain family protein [Solimonas soli]|uniref:murein L,D-transpeptidase catalytic domain family protein n=1 Tax=Solimonas soli TaxID=413479 RepID=UPI0004AECCAF|nr:murein L,D-transpeptidase catalytic domain family protein [Solimonas soli]
MRFPFRSAPAAALAWALPLCGHAAPPASTLYASLHAAAPDVQAAALQAAVDALACASAAGDLEARRLALIDYSLPSTQQRLWVFDLDGSKLLFRELVAHGRNSGDRDAQRFSNRDGSLQSSIGLFRTGGSYVGGKGYSLRLDGLEPGVNDLALQRAIVIHGAPYVDAALAAKQGRIGRSWGCPAVRAGIARPLIDAMKNGQLLFSYYPDPRWLASSRFLNCAARDARRDTLAQAGSATTMRALAAP